MPSEPDQQSAARKGQAGTAPRPNSPPLPMMVEEDSGSPFGARVRRVPGSPELVELTRIAVALGDPRAA